MEMSLNIRQKVLVLVIIDPLSLGGKFPPICRIFDGQGGFGGKNIRENNSKHIAVSMCWELCKCITHGLHPSEVDIIITPTQQMRKRRLLARLEHRQYHGLMSDAQSPTQYITICPINTACSSCHYISRLVLWSQKKIIKGY